MNSRRAQISSGGYPRTYLSNGHIVSTTVEGNGVYNTVVLKGYPTKAVGLTLRSYSLDEAKVDHDHAVRTAVKYV